MKINKNSVKNEWKYIENDVVKHKVETKGGSIIIEDVGNIKELENKISEFEIKKTAHQNKRKKYLSAKNGTIEDRVNFIFEYFFDDYFSEDEVDKRTQNEINKEKELIDKFNEYNSLERKNVKLD